MDRRIRSSIVRFTSRIVGWSPGKSRPSRYRNARSKRAGGCAIGSCHLVSCGDAGSTLLDESSTLNSRPSANSQVMESVSAPRPPLNVLLKSAAYSPVASLLSTTSRRFGLSQNTSITSWNPSRPRAVTDSAIASRRSRRWRSEEHTSELQSRRDLVCRLLLEKKKKTNQTNKNKNSTKKHDN